MDACESAGQPPAHRALYLRLSAMMFLQATANAAWAAMIAKHMDDLGFSSMQIALVFLTTALGTVISPLLVGWIADRFLASQRFLAICHGLSALLMFAAWRQIDFEGLWWAMFCYSIVFYPTMALTNTITFYHMGDSERFGTIRVWGTIGCICIQWTLAGYLYLWEQHAPGASHNGDCLIIAAMASLVMALYCLTLPHTPPGHTTERPYAFLDVLRLVRSRNFGVLIGVSFAVAVALPFHYNLTLLFLTEAEPYGVGLAPSAGQLATTLGQLAEIVTMLLLWPAIRYLGMRWTFVLGILAWPVRFGLFTLGQPLWLMVAAQSLHGIGYTFFFAAGMVAVERMSPKGLRASAQSLLVFATYGVGMLCGHLLSGAVHGYFTLAHDAHAWEHIFMVPICITVPAAIAFGLLFDEKRFRQNNALRDAG